MSTSRVAGAILSTYPGVRWHLGLQGTQTNTSMAWHGQAALIASLARSL